MTGVLEWSISPSCKFAVNPVQHEDCDGRWFGNRCECPVCDHPEREFATKDEMFAVLWPLMLEWEKEHPVFTLDDLYRMTLSDPSDENVLRARNYYGRQSGQLTKRAKKLGIIEEEAFAHVPDTEGRGSRDANVWKFVSHDRGAAEAYCEWKGWSLTVPTGRTDL